MVRTIYWDLIGTGVGSGRVPCLGHWYSKPALFADVAGLADPHYRALVFGREIRTLNLAMENSI